MKIFTYARRFCWACLVGFMIAWHNVYNHDDRLREDTKTKIEIVEEQEDDGN